MKLRVLTLLFVACTSHAATPFDEADNLVMSRDQQRARELFVKAAASDPDPRRRDQAHLRAARIDWYVLHDTAAAREELAKVPETSLESSAAHSERSRLETELVHDFDAARSAAKLALDTAKTPTDREQAITRAAAANIEEARRTRDAGKCPDRAPLAESIAALRHSIQETGPTVERSLLLLHGALLEHDDDAALYAWQSYDTDLPALVPKSFGDRKSVAMALASAKLFDFADLVLRDPCTTTPIESDATTRDIVAYAASLRRIGALADEHHRATAAGSGDDKQFRNALGEEGAALWRALSWNGNPPQFSLNVLQDELSRRFGTVITLGKTEGIFNLVYGHRVADEVRTVEQYGHRGTLHFIQIDGMISGGFSTWVTHGLMGTGGWSGDDATVYQIRPMYADDPTRLWRRITDPVERARADEKMISETDRDRERGAHDAIVSLPGLQMRLRQQYGDALRARLVAQGLQGEELRAAFQRTAAADKLASSIWAHEGRHAIDKVLGISKSEELEFRAKLSEVAFAPAPRTGMGSILSPVGGSGAHGAANARVLKGVAAWIRAHAEEIGGFDASAPALTQLDRLTDEQMRTAFRSLDPLWR